MWFSILDTTTIIQVSTLNKNKLKMKRFNNFSEEPSYDLIKSNEILDKSLQERLIDTSKKDTLQVKIMPLKPESFYFKSLKDYLKKDKREFWIYEKLGYVIAQLPNEKVIDLSFEPYVKQIYDDTPFF